MSPTLLRWFVGIIALLSIAVVVFLIVSAFQNGS
jgi:hypothetical protein